MILKKDKEEIEEENKKTLKEKIKDKYNEKKEEVTEKIDKAKNNYEKIQLIISFIGAIYFAVNLFLTASKDYKDNALYPFIIGFTVLYILVFIIFLIIHRKDRKQITKDTKKFNSNLKLIKAVLNLLFIGSSLLIFIDSIKGLSLSSGIFNIVQTAISGFLLLFKFFSTIRKIFKNIKKKIKTAKKEKKKALKEKEIEEE